MFPCAAMSGSPVQRSKPIHSQGRTLYSILHNLSSCLEQRANPCSTARVCARRAVLASLHLEVKCGKSGQSSKQIPGIRRTPTQRLYEKSTQRFVAVARVRPGCGLPASIQTERRSQTEDGRAPDGQRGKRPASGGWSGESQTIGEATVRIQIGSAKSDA